MIKNESNDISLGAQMNEDKSCHICGSPAEVFLNNYTHKIRCMKCGEYSLSMQFHNYLTPNQFTEKERANISGWIRENQGCVFAFNNLEFLKTIATPTPMEKAEKLLMHLSKEYSSLGDEIPAPINQILAFEYLGVSWAKDMGEVSYLLKNILVASKHYLEQLSSDKYMITPDGWSHLAESGIQKIDSNIAFVAMRFNEDMKDFYWKAIKPAIEACGYEPKIMFEEDHIGKIDDAIVAAIKKSRFIVADFTEQNQGAYYEAGYARGLGLPVISTCNKKEVDEGKLHFDTRQYRTILWEKDKLDAFTKELQDCIEANIGRGKFTKL